MGFISQDIEKVMPQWVGVGPEGYNTLHTVGIDALLAEAIKDLKKRNEMLNKDK